MGFPIFFLLCLACSSYAVGPAPVYVPSFERAASCGIQFRNLSAVHSHHLRLTQELFPAMGNSDKSVEYLHRNGVDLVIGPGNTIRGQPARFSASKTGENDGFFNQGIFYYGPLDRRRAVKLISEVPAHGPGKMAKSEVQSVSQMMHGLEGAMIGEAVDAPKVYAFGKATYQGKQYYYVEMEEIFATQKPTILKNVLHSQQGHTLIKPASGISPLPSMARHFVDAFSKQIAPTDADFIISEKGEVRWIDPFAWKIRLWKNTLSPNPDRGKTGNNFTHFMYRFTQNSPDAAKVFFRTFLTELKADKSMSDFEKQLLLEDLFFSGHQSEPALQRRLRDYMQKVGVTSFEGAEPLQDVLRIYDALP